MSWKYRILRDGTIVLLLCGVFFYSAKTLTPAESFEEQAFSSDRTLADHYLTERKWSLADTHFEKLTDKDPFNGYAWFNRALCNFWIRAELLEEINQKTASGETSETDLAALQEKLQTLEEKLIYLFEQSSEFLRHRRRSLVNLAVLHADREEWEKSLDCLELYVSERNLLSRTLQNFNAFGSGGKAMIGTEPNQTSRLHCFPRFWKIVDDELDYYEQRPLPTSPPFRRRPSDGF